MTTAEINDPTTRSDDEFRAWLARVDATPAAVESAEVVNAVANAAHLAACDCGEEDVTWSRYWQQIALAAVLALADRHTETEQAVGRVLALADSLEAEAAVIAAHARVPVADFVKFWRDDAPGRIRAALAGGGRP